jgi:hypothetical protein
VNEPVTVFLRSPSPTEAELVVGEGGGQCRIVRLDFDQLRLLAAQVAGTISRWPVEVGTPTGRDGRGLDVSAAATRTRNESLG